MKNLFSTKKLEKNSFYSVNENLKKKNSVNEKRIVKKNKGLFFFVKQTLFLFIFSTRRPNTCIVKIF